MSQVHELPNGTPPSPQVSDGGDSRSFLIGSVFSGVVIAAIVPAYAHVLYVVGRWSWQLIG